jgi:hypothetical protein
MLWFLVSRAAALLLTLALVAGGTRAAEPRARLVGPVPTLTVGRAWAAAVRIESPAPKPLLVARLGPQRVRFALRRVTAHLYRAGVRFPRAGRWQLEVLLGRRRVPLRTVQVSPARLGLAQPAQIVVAPDGMLLVAERGARGRVARVDPSTGSVTTFATGVDDPYGLAFAQDGSLLVSGAGGIHRAPPGGGPLVRVAQIDAGPIVAAPDGDLYFAWRDGVGRLPSGAKDAEQLPVPVMVPHALVLIGAELFVADSGNGRILRIDLGTRRIEELVTGLRAPLALAGDGRGGLVAADYATGVVFYLSRDGQTRPLASRLVRPYAVAVRGDVTYIVEAGDLARATGAIKRIAADGTVSPLPLRRG